MDQKRQILSSTHLNIIISRLCHQIIETHEDLSNSVILGIQPRGIFLAERIKKRLIEFLNKEISIGYIDATFHRDDFRRREKPIAPNVTKVPFIIENKKVILVDDVLYTGRTVRAAMDSMISFGRPAKVELLVLVDRKYSRDLPIEPNYIGKSVNTIHSQRVIVDLLEMGKEEDNIWLVEKEEH